MAAWFPTVILFLSIATPISTARECIGTLPNEAHGIRGTFCVNDHLTFSIDGFYYDGLGPEAFPYYYLQGTMPNRNGGGVIFPAEENPPSDRFTRAYFDEDIVLRIPVEHDRTVCDIGWFTIWCRRARQLFTRIEMTEAVRTFLNCSTPTTETPVTMTTETPVTMTTETPVTMTTETPETTQPVVTQPPTVDSVTFDNCRRLSTRMELSWTLNRSTQVATFRLCGCISDIETSDNQYLGFGLSGSTAQTQMLGADATITWVDDKRGPQAVDYFLSGNIQCGPDNRGACPDEVDSSGSCTNDVFAVSGFKEDGLQCITYSRNFSTSDTACDLTIDPDNTQQYIVWGIGGLGETAFKHFERATMNDPPLHLGREPKDECSSAARLECRGCEGFEGVTMVALEDRTFRVRIGPAGSERGYRAITDEEGWGIAYFIDRELIPELVVQRGRTYTFIVEAGDDPTYLAEYHPLYITDSASGGRELLNQQQKANETVFAGYNFTVDPTTGEILEERPVAFGRYCEYQQSTEAAAILDSCGSLADYTAALVGFCKSGSVGVLEWTPDEDTPDTVYYQCANHFNLGWRIRVQGARGSSGSALATIASWLTALLLVAVTLVLRL